jgi:hypothetical protein
MAFAAFLLEFVQRQGERSVSENWSPSARFERSTAVTLKNAGFWDVVHCECR